MFKHDYKVGDSAHYGQNGDYYPVTVIRVTPTRVFVQSANYVCTKPMSSYGAQDAEFEFSPNPNGRIAVFTVKKNGRVTEKGTNYCFLNHGYAFEQNPSF